MALTAPRVLASMTRRSVSVRLIGSPDQSKLIHAPVALRHVAAEVDSLNIRHHVIASEGDRHDVIDAEAPRMWESQLSADALVADLTLPAITICYLAGRVALRRDACETCS